MVNFFKKILISGMFFYPQLTLAQDVDIPEFMDEDEPEIYEEEAAPQQSVPTQTTSATTFTVGQATITQKPQEKNPNLGRNETPLERLVYSHSPLPELSIDLTKKEPESVPQVKQWDPISLTPTLEQEMPALTDMVDETVLIKGTTNSLDARDYELEGFALGMTPLDVGKIALKNGYKITKSQKEFPLFLTTRYEQECRLEGLYLPADIRACIRQKGKENDTIFLKTMTITKPGNKESYVFEFTSPATENRAWRITYSNKGDNSLNFTQINTSKKLSRRDQFFQAVFNKFGYPSDSTNFIWGAKDDAFMQVSMYGSNYDAKITLTDTLLSDEDYFAAKEWIDEQPSLEKFDFGE